MAVAEAHTGIVRYWELKRLFFGKHSYRGGNYAPLLPVAILVKRDERGVPTECHVRPARVAVPQVDCVILLKLLEEVPAAPLLRALWSPEGGRFLYGGPPGSLQEAVTLLEDVPSGLVEGVINNIFIAPRAPADGAEIVLGATATLTAVDEKYPLVLLLVGELEQWWRAARAAVERWLLEGARGDPFGRCRECSGLVRRARRLLEGLQGRTVSAMVVLREPPLAVYPVFLG